MKKETRTELERISKTSGFHSKVATTVLSTGNCSWKQMEILNQVSEIFIDLDDFEIDVTNLKVDQKFWEMIDNQRRNQLPSSMR